MLENKELFTFIVGILTSIIAFYINTRLTEFRQTKKLACAFSAEITALINQYNKIGGPLLQKNPDGSFRVFTTNIKEKEKCVSNVFASQASAKKLLNHLKDKISSTENTVEFKREIIMSIVDKITVATIDESKKSNMNITIHYKFNKNEEKSVLPPHVVDDTLVRVDFLGILIMLVPVPLMK